MCVSTVVLRSTGGRSMGGMRGRVDVCGEMPIGNSGHAAAQVQAIGTTYVQ